MLHLDGAIRLFDPDAESTLRQAPACMFHKHGHLHREILDVIRQAEAPITPRAIAERLIADRPEIAGSARNLGDRWQGAAGVGARMCRAGSRKGRAGGRGCLARGGRGTGRLSG